LLLEQTDSAALLHLTMHPLENLLAKRIAII